MNEHDSFKYILIQKWTDMYEWVALVHILIHIYISIIHAHTRCMHICMFHTCTGSRYRRWNPRSQAGARSSFICVTWLIHIYVFITHVHTHSMHLKFKDERDQSDSILSDNILIISYVHKSPISKTKPSTSKRSAINLIRYYIIIHYIFDMCTGSWYRR